MPRATTDEGDPGGTTRSRPAGRSPWLRELAAGGLASAFLVAGIGFLPSLPLALLLSVGVYFGVRLFASGLLPDVSTPGRSSATAALDARAARLDVLAADLERARKPEAAQMVHALARLLRELGAHFRRDPQNVERAGTFLDLQLPKAVDIVERYTFLVAQPYLDARGRSELEASERTLGLMKKAFEEQHRRVLDQDVREIGLDRRVFEELLRLDGSVVDEMPEREAAQTALETRT